MRINCKGLIALFLLISVLSITLTSCNLGDFEDEAEYEMVIDEVLLYDSEGDDDSYSILQFYNKDTTANMSTPVDDFDSYMCLALEVSEDRYLEDMAMYFTSDQEGTLEIAVYIAGDEPEIEEPDDDNPVDNPILTTFKGESNGVSYSATFSEEKDEDTVIKKLVYTIGTATYNTTYFDIPKSEGDGIGFTIAMGGLGHYHKCRLKPSGLQITDTYNNKTVTLVSDSQKSYIATKSVSLSNGEWTAVQFSDLYKNGQKVKQIKIEEDNYIILEFKNNCYDASYYQLTPVKIKITNIMVRLVEA